MKMKSLTALFLFIGTAICAQDHAANSSSRANDHAPIGVMGDHTHNQGEWMVSYRYMSMQMEGLQNGEESVPFTAAHEQYPVTPTQMTMKMHMVGAMFAISKKITLMTMVNYAANEMDHLIKNGRRFTTRSSGIADAKVAGLVRLLHQPKQRLHAEVGLMLPTGNIDAADVIPASEPNAVVLPYPMQLGSGSWSPTVALTYQKNYQQLVFGAQSRVTFSANENANAYRLGNQYQLTGWAALNLTPWVSASARVQGQRVEAIAGANPTLNPRMVTTADTENTGSDVLQGGVGLNFLVPQGKASGLRLGLEFQQPFYQNLNGFQLQRREVLTAGIQYAF